MALRKPKESLVNQMLPDAQEIRNFRRKKLREQERRKKKEKKSPSVPESKAGRVAMQTLMSGKTPPKRASRGTLLKAK